ncbi:MAG: AAA family ATPase, partial [Bacteroidota bacterium]
MKDPKLKIVEITVRPSYREKNGNFPFSHTIKVPIVCVFGPNQRGYFECHLPWFGESFYYYQPKEFNALIQHFGTNLLNNLRPDELNRLMLHGKPKLETIQLRVNTNRDYSDFQKIEDRYPALSRLAERYPPTKAIRKNMGAFPDAAWEMENHVENVIEKMITSRSNVLLSGNHGVGKSAILRQAIRKVATQSRKQKLNYSFWQIVPQRITASSKYLGEWQETVEELIEDLTVAQGILWVTDFIRLLQIGGEGPEDSVAAFLISFIQQGRLQLIGEVTPQELDSIKRMLPGFIENFQVIQVDELPEVKIRNILNKITEFSGSNLKVRFSQDAIELAYRLLMRYFPYESFPGKAAKFLGQCVNEAQLNNENQVGKNEIITNFIQQTGMPELFLRDDMLLDVEALDTFFKARIIGQQDAIE